MSLQDAMRAPGRRSFIIVMVVLAALALWFILTGALRYAVYDAAVYGPLWPRRFALLPHIAGGLIALSAGLVQVWLGVTGRTRQLHKVLGRIYLGGVAVGSLGGFYLALTAGDTLTYRSGLFGLATAWSLTTALAWLAARRKLFEQHREWMLRSYTVTFAFVTFRLGSDVLLKSGIGSASDIFGMMAWAAWAVPLLLAEPLLQYRKLKRR